MHACLWISIITHQHQHVKFGNFIWDESNSITLTIITVKQIIFDNGAGNINNVNIYNNNHGTVTVFANIHAFYLLNSLQLFR